MPKVIDETNNKYKNWIVLERDPESFKKRAKWICECQICKNKKSITGTDLRTNKIPDCPICRQNSEIGNKYGKLTVISFYQKNIDRHYIWTCKCDCGNIENIEGTRLRSREKNQCNECSRKEHIPQYIDETNNIYGALKVIKYDENKSHSKNAYWICQCQCGNIISVSGIKLRNGQISCGCLKSKGEFKINQLLTENNFYYKTQIKFSNCINPKTNKELPFDFGVYKDKNKTELKYLIEYDGQQHFDYKNRWYNTEEDFKEQQERDKIKDKYCKDNNIPLIRISYNQYDSLTIEDLK